MPNPGTLDVLIAMVIVILVLSLVVQSLQTLVKKIFKLKSRSILNSLEDLFETIMNKPATAAGTAAGTAAATAAGTAAGAAAGTAKTPKQLVTDVTTRLKDMGRKSLFGNPMLDSLAKGDLLKILTRVKAEDLMPGAVNNFQNVLAGIHALEDEIGKIDTNLLNGDSNARFAAIQGSIMPLLHDLEALASGGNIDSAVFFGDLFKLRQLKAADVLNLLGQVQEEVSKDLEAAKTARNEAASGLSPAKITSGQSDAENDNGKVIALEHLDTGLKTIANKIASLSTSFDAAFAPLIARLEQVEVWYDTVMQGFEERYTRHMRTVGIVISIGVVVVLNANFFSIYRSIKSDPVKTALIVQQGEDFLKPAPVSAASPLPSASPSPAPTETPVTVADVKEDLQRVEDLAGVYESFGITPLSRQQIGNVFSGNWRWRDLNETILGWVIMVMLLSAGAPFWQDTLESLFGVKNLLRKKSDTKNVEEGKGGQPKP